MPSALKVPRIDPRQHPMVVCIESHTNARGLFRVGDVLRADDPDVVALPVCYMPQGQTTADIHAEHQRRFFRVED